MITISDEPMMWLRGDLCGLGPLRRDLVELYWHWENELRVMTGNGRQTPNRSMNAAPDSTARCATQ